MDQHELLGFVIPGHWRGWFLIALSLSFFAASLNWAFELLGFMLVLMGLVFFFIAPYNF